MKRLIYASTAPSVVNRIGKYLNNNIDGAFKIQFRANECEITMRMYYQAPDSPDLKEMHFIINVTTYQNKLRINITEDDEMEKTIGQVILMPEELNDLSLIKYKVMKALRKAISKEYAGYDFIY